jgi:excisionase family DNA binding protein
LPGTTDEQLYLNTEEVAALMRRNIKTVRVMLERGDLPGAKVGNRWYIRREDLDALLAGTQ